ncbi:MAG: GerAB/ArcD/ProY family transporter [Christensenellales bacterium]
MGNTAMTDGNKVYASQFLLFAFMSTVAFKVLMLPKYLATATGATSWLIMAIMSVIELGYLALLYYISLRGGIFGDALPSVFKKVAAVAIIISCAVKLCVFGGEFCSYVGTSVFDGVNWLYIALALVPCLAYVASRGLNSLGRACQILFWVIAFTVNFNVFFARLEGNAYNLLPFGSFADAVEGVDRHIVWFADFTPLLLVSSSSAKRQRAISIFTLILTAIFPTLITVFFLYSYGDGAVFVDNAISRLTDFHLLATIMGKADLFTVVSWLILAVVKLSLIFYALTASISVLIGEHKVTPFVLSALVVVAIVFAMRDVDRYYLFGTSPIRYVVGGIEYLLPVVTGITLGRKYAKK